MPLLTDKTVEVEIISPEEQEEVTSKHLQILQQINKQNNG
jgi:hypothetical protein